MRIHSYDVEFKTKNFSISSRISAFNKDGAAISASLLFKKDSHVPEIVKGFITAKAINVKRIYKGRG